MPCRLGDEFRGTWECMLANCHKPHTTACTIILWHGMRAPTTTWVPLGEGLPLPYQDHIPVHDADVQCTCGTLP